MVTPVSIKKINTDTWRTQITQAIDHSEPEEWSTDPKTIYALVINNGNMEKQWALLNIYEELEPTARAKGDVRLIPIWAWDFAQIVLTLCEDDHPVGLHFKAEDLARVLDTIHENVVDQLKDNKPGWTRATFLAALEGKPFPGEEEARERAALGDGPAVEIRPIKPVDHEWLDEWLGLDSESSEEPEEP